MAESGPRLPDQGARLPYLCLITLVAAVGGFLFGYDLSLISGALLFLKPEWQLSPPQVGLVTGSAILGCPFGPLAGLWLADTFGRNKTLILSAVLFIASAAGSALAAGLVDFCVWRFVGGIGVGLASTVSPMYIAEVSPARLRGRLVVVNQLAIVIGLSLSVYVSYLLSFGGHWRWMFATMGLPAAILLAGLFFVPRSPRWLAARGDDAGALAVLARINGAGRAAEELREIREELGVQTGRFRELLAPGVRLALAIGVTLMVFSQINGVNMILIYAPTLFQEAGAGGASAAILSSVWLTAWITLCTVAAFWLTARFGRRPILICGTIGMACGHAIIFLGFAGLLPHPMIAAGMFAAAGAFTLTLAPLSWVILSEIFPNRVRGKAMSIATMAMFTASYLLVNVYPMILDGFKQGYGHPGGTFLIFIAVCLGCAAFVWRLLPETKDKTLEEIGGFWLRAGRKTTSM
jgi:sugar porter (SP) family MFS transporter